MPAIALFPIASEWQAYSVYGTYHITDHAGRSAFCSDCSRLQGRKRTESGYGDHGVAASRITFDSRAYAGHAEGLW